jgi:hypothetical protein
VPEAAPCANGVNVTDIVQLTAGFNTDGQLLVSENGPVAETVSPFMLLPPKLVTVMVWGALGEPMFCVNVSVVGVNRIAEGRGVGSGIGTVAQMFA